MKRGKFLKIVSLVVAFAFFITTNAMAAMVAKTTSSSELAWKYIDDVVQRDPTLGINCLHGKEGDLYFYSSKGEYEILKSNVDYLSLTNSRVIYQKGVIPIPHAVKGELTQIDFLNENLDLAAKYYVNSKEWLYFYKDDLGNLWSLNSSGKKEQITNEMANALLSETGKEVKTLANDYFSSISESELREMVTSGLFSGALGGMLPNVLRKLGELLFTLGREGLVAIAILTAAVILLCVKSKKSEKELKKSQKPLNESIEKGKVPADSTSGAKSTNNSATSPGTIINQASYVYQ